MKTGEGKTEVATMPAYLNALTGEGVHIVTVNDYLAKVGADLMGKVYRFLGLTVGTILHDMTNAQRREAYACDITYCTNNELGFDYLRDNMAIYKKRHGAARAFVRDRGRGGLHLNRRGAYAAHYFRPGRGIPRSFTRSRITLQRPPAPCA